MIRNSNRTPIWVNKESGVSPGAPSKSHGFINLSGSHIHRCPVYNWNHLREPLGFLGFKAGSTSIKLPVFWFGVFDTVKIGWLGIVDGGGGVGMVNRFEGLFVPDRLLLEEGGCCSSSEKGP